VRGHDVVHANVDVVLLGEEARLGADARGALRTAAAESCDSAFERAI
jgi:hypothetical protein